LLLSQFATLEGSGMNMLRRNLIALGAMSPILGCTNEHGQGKKMTEQIHDVEPKGGYGFTYPMPSLATSGEKINLLIRIKKAMPYTAALVFVEPQDWPKDRQDRLFQIYKGRASGHEPDEMPYPIKLRFQLDSVDAPVPVHVDVVCAERSSAYLTFYPDGYPKLPNGQHSVIWRANGLWGIRQLEPGVYRVRINNLNPAPEVDFETLFQFLNNSRKV
jgi:hypothetical protein